MLWDEKLKKTFCCYNCLDLYHAQSFFLVFVTCFPTSLQQELGKQVTHTLKKKSPGKSRQLQQQNTISPQKNRPLGPVHLDWKSDKLDYLRSPSQQKKNFIFLASKKLLAPLRSGIGTCSVFCHSFSVSPNVSCNKNGVFFYSWQLVQYCRKRFVFVDLLGKLLNSMRILEHKVTY